MSPVGSRTPLPAWPSPSSFTRLHTAPGMHPECVRSRPAPRPRQIPAEHRPQWNPQRRSGREERGSPAGAAQLSHSLSRRDPRLRCAPARPRCPDTAAPAENMASAGSRPLRCRRQGRQGPQPRECARGITFRARHARAAQTHSALLRRTATSGMTHFRPLAIARDDGSLTTGLCRT